MTWRSVQESIKRVDRLFFLPDEVKPRYRKARAKCSCPMCTAPQRIFDRRDDEKALDEVKEFWRSPFTGEN